MIKSIFTVAALLQLSCITNSNITNCVDLSPPQSNSRVQFNDLNNNLFSSTKIPDRGVDYSINPYASSRN